MIKINHIIEGISNSIFVKEEVEKIAEQRYSHCKICPKNSKNKHLKDLGPYYSSLRPDEHCTECACNIHAKVRSLHTSCPLEIWNSLSTLEDSIKIQEALKKQD